MHETGRFVTPVLAQFLEMQTENTGIMQTENIGLILQKISKATIEFVKFLIKLTN